MDSPRDDDPTPADRTSDGFNVRYAGQFGFALLGYLLVDMGLMLLMAIRFEGQPPMRMMIPTVIGLVVLLGFAIFTRVAFGWRGVLAGALTATITMIVSGAVVLMVITRFKAQGL